jgi:hypothetical protein
MSKVKDISKPEKPMLEDIKIEDLPIQTVQTEPTESAKPFTDESIEDILKDI